jgi:hypothetical protein
MAKPACLHRQIIWDQSSKSIAKVLAEKDAELAAAGWMIMTPAMRARV